MKQAVDTAACFMFLFLVQWMPNQAPDFEQCLFNINLTISLLSVLQFAFSFAASFAFVFTNSRSNYQLSSVEGFPLYYKTSKVSFCLTHVRIRKYRPFLFF